MALEDLDACPLGMLIDLIFYLAVVCGLSDMPLAAALLHLRFSVECAREENAIQAGFLDCRHGPFIDRRVKGENTYSVGGRGWARAIHRAFVTATSRMPQPARPFWWDEPELQEVCRQRISVGLDALRRGHRCRTHLARARRAAIKLQACFRSQLAWVSMQVRQRVRAVLKLQAAARSSMARARIRTLRTGAAIRLQASFRGQTLRCGWPRLRRQKFDELMQRHTHALADLQSTAAAVARQRSFEVNEREQEFEREQAVERLASRAAIAEIEQRLRVSEAEASKSSSLASERQARVDALNSTHDQLKADLAARERDAKELAAMLRRQAQAHTSEQQVVRASVAQARHATGVAQRELEAAQAAAAHAVEQRNELQLELLRSQESLEQVMQDTQQMVRAADATAEAERHRATTAGQELAKACAGQTPARDLTLIHNPIPNFALAPTSTSISPGACIPRIAVGSRPG